MAGIRDILRIQRAQLRNLVEYRGVRRLGKVYREAQAGLADSLAELEKTGRGQSFSAHHMRQMLLQSQVSVRYLETKLGEQLVDTGKLTAKMAPRQLYKAVKALETHFTGHSSVAQVDQAALFSRVYRKVEPSLLNRFDQSKRFYGPPVVDAIRMELAKGLIQGKTVDDMVSSVAGTDGVFANQRWRAERIVRTELAYASNYTQFQGMKELAKEGGPTHKKLVATFDDRTGEDSKILHGQIRLIDEPFEYDPPDGKGGYPPYMMPPGRPNDREVAIPWRLEWGETKDTQAFVEPPIEVRSERPREIEPGPNYMPVEIPPPPNIVRSEERQDRPLSLPPDLPINSKSLKNFMLSKGFVESNPNLPADTRDVHMIAGTWKPERVELHNKIAKSYLDQAKPVPPTQKPVAILMMGGPGSGKSSATDNMDLANYVPCDPDGIKNKLPEFKEGLASKALNSAGMVHKESSDITRQILSAAVDQRKNLFMDGLGVDFEKMSKRIADLKASGYEVRLVGVHLPAKEGIKRAAARAWATGRWVDLDEVVEPAYGIIPGNFQRLHGLADSVALYDNNVPFGKKPILMFAKKHGGKAEVLDAERYDAFKGNVE